MRPTLCSHPLHSGTNSVEVKTKRERQHGLPENILTRVNRAGNKGYAQLPFGGTSAAELKAALLSLAPDASLGRVLSIAAAERLIAQAREFTDQALKREGKLGRPRKVTKIGEAAATTPMEVDA